ncbi:hypothetical protein QUA71_06915 [Microcoleus sp. MON1_C5]|uniref:hypothetical protein n=1 Tax=Microcoleus sp. MON1_C5 TaxID=2818828 RepID=UPI002FD00029
MMFPFSSAPPPAHSLPPDDSIDLKSLKTTSDRLFQSICGAIGGLAAHSARSAPQYFPLLVICALAAIIVLATVPPRNKDFLGLYRSGALILAIGVLLPFWDLLLGIPQQVVVGAVVLVIVLVIALVAFLGRN